MKQRIISALVMALIIIPFIIIGGNIFYIGLSVVALIGYMEILKVKEKEKKIPLPVKGISLLSYILLLTHDWFYYFNYTLEHKIILVLFLIIMPILIYKKKDEYNIVDALFIFGCTILLGLGFNRIAVLRIESLSLFVYLILITIVTDTFAYITGSLIGKNKMCPAISPNKTWEGFAGGVLMATIICTLVLNAVSSSSIIVLILITLFLSIVSQLGDLIFSAIKRHFDVKDFSNLIPGHGGILDRFDSLIFVSIVFSMVSRFI